jgi:hypothetical protein
MSAHKKDTSILEKYRELYETGQIIQTAIQNKTGIGKRAFERHIRTNNWNIKLALENQNKLYKEKVFQKMLPYKVRYENGEMTIKDIAKKINAHQRIISEMIKKYNWNIVKNQKKKSSAYRNEIHKKATEKKQAFLAEQEYWKALYEIEHFLNK